MQPVWSREHHRPDGGVRDLQSEGFDLARGDQRALQGATEHREQLNSAVSCRVQALGFDVRLAGRRETQTKPPQLVNYGRTSFAPAFSASVASRKA